MPKFQLYHTNMALEMPGAVVYSRNNKTATVRKRTLTKQVYIFWPNGAPCALINAWLQHITARATGDSAETFASHMSHYVRYCFNEGAQLLSADDTFLQDFANYLMDEKKVKHSALSRARSPNHVAYTIRRVLDFFIWYQINCRLASQAKLIGELGTGAQITIEWRGNKKGSPALHHPAIPTTRPPVGDKKPMPDDFIGKINLTIMTLKSQPRFPFKINTAPKRNDFIAKNEYLYSRRLTTVRLSKITGLRPDELNSIPLHLNLHPIKSRVLFIPTLKTRQKPKPIREFPLSLEDAIDISIYLKARHDFLVYLGIDTSTSTSFMLSHDGKHIETRSLARDFKRLCVLSGLADVQVCLSMFRHRFITTQIAYEISVELRRDLAQKDLWQEAVQRRILVKVAKLTGHRDPMSLIHYFDEGFAIAIAIAKATAKSPNQKNTLMQQLESTVHTLSQNPELYTNPNLAKTVAELEQILLKLKAT